ncbi:MAG: histidinol-phosphate transaminase [Bacteroidota bacterium]
MTTTNIQWTDTAIRQLVRPNILNLKAYSSARSEFKGKAEVLMDANESPFETGMNRYPDPLATEIRLELARIKAVEPSQIMLGNGSDELVDYVTRIFCRPGEDAVIALPPTFGMYKVAAGLNDAEFVSIPLTPDFQLPVAQIEAAITERTKVLWICSPNNPSGNLMKREEVAYLLRIFPGIVVIDEAYVEYTPEDSFIPELEKYPNLIITQTLSKAWGLAGIRLGAAYSSELITGFMRTIKPPYNVNILTQKEALKQLLQPAKMQERVEFLVSERQRLAAALEKLGCVEHIFPSVTNFLLVRFTNGQAVYEHLLGEGIVVRNQTQQPNCANCLRITVGTAEENERFLKRLSEF